MFYRKYDEKWSFILQNLVLNIFKQRVIIKNINLGKKRLHYRLQKGSDVWLYLLVQKYGKYKDVPFPTFSKGHNDAQKLHAQKRLPGLLACQAAQEVYTLFALSSEI